MQLVDVLIFLKPASTNLRTDLCWRSGLANHGEYRIEGPRFDPATGDNEWEEGLSC